MHLLSTTTTTTLLLLLPLLLLTPVPTESRDATKDITYYLMNCAADTNAVTSCQARRGAEKCTNLFITARGRVGVMNVPVNPRGWSMGASGTKTPSNTWGTDLKPMIPMDGQMGWYRTWEGTEVRLKGFDGYNGQTVTARVGGGSHRVGQRNGRLGVQCSAGETECVRREGVEAAVVGADLSYVYASQRAAFEGESSSSQPVWYYCWRVYEASV
ncbi:hypothetical protein HDU67_009242 [Dinochytrium kinnereticum]|nr:hypothetical protein HDU67_009242 [Dinochytrium kinnereticum]